MVNIPDDFLKVAQVKRRILKTGMTGSVWERRADVPVLGKKRESKGL